MEFPPPKPPGTPIPPTPFLDGDSTPSPFYPPIDTKHLIPTDSRRGSLVQFHDPFQTPPASPLSRFFGPNGGGAGSVEAGGTGGNAAGTGSPTASNAQSSSSPSSSIRKPFNFQPMAAAKSPVIGKPAQRRGHRYKHSSVSHQIFLEPPPRAPLSLPASLPVPTIREILSSITPPQRTRALWCLTHTLTAIYILYSSGGSLALTALSHVILFDAIGACVLVAVEVLGNFEVWKRSTIRHPFGLERVEVLAGFAMAVFIVFMGLDIISHTAEHFLEGMEGGEGGEAGHHHGSGGDCAGGCAGVKFGALNLPVLLAIISTLISALFLGNTARIGRAMFLNYNYNTSQKPAYSSASISSTSTHHSEKQTNASSNILPSSSSSSTTSSSLLPPSTLTLLTSNPSHILILATSTILLLTPPLLRIPLPPKIDTLLALTTSLFMLLFGIRLLKSLGSMLLMSIHLPPGSIEGVVGEIEGLAGCGVKRVLEAKVWQVHYGLGIVGLKVLLERGEEEGRMAGQVRERAERIVRERLGGCAAGGGGAGVKWEVSVAVFVD